MADFAENSEVLSKDTGDLSQVIYSSQAVESMDDLQLAQILAQCREFNDKHDVTGMLLYKQGRFLQVLEGKRAVVNELMSRIHADNRHHDVEVLFDEDVDGRKFPDWTMAFSNLDRLELSQFDGLSRFSDAVFNDDYFRSKNVSPQEILQAFKTELWDNA